jgi:hypothetical protein
MKTKVRVQRSKSTGYEHLTMLILQPHKYSPNSLSSIGHISWQGDEKHGWYGMKFVMEADRIDSQNFLTMYKLICYINERITSENPVEVMAVMGGEQHFYDFGEYISIMDNGKQVYDVKKKGDINVYTRVIAANEIMASRVVQGRIKRKELPDVDLDIIPTGSRINFEPVRLEFGSTIVSLQRN